MFIDLKVFWQMHHKHQGFFLRQRDFFKSKKGNKKKNEVGKYLNLIKKIKLYFFLKYEGRN